MNNRINQLLNKLAQEPLDHSLICLERDVERAFRGERQHFAISILKPLQLSVLGVALIVGVAIGGMTGASRDFSSHSLFAAEEKLAVSTILEGG